MSSPSEQESVSLKPLQWGWYLSIGSVIVGACIILVMGDRSVAPVIAIPLVLLLFGTLVALADHSRQSIHGTGAESERARLLSNMMQPLLAKLIFFTSTVIVVSGLGSAFGLGAPAGWFWGAITLIIALILVGFRQYATIIKQVDTICPATQAPSYFKLGIFYFNPDDDEIIINWGGINIPNFGNKYFWVLVAVLLGFSILITTLASLAG